MSNFEGFESPESQDQLKEKFIEKIIEDAGVKVHMSLPSECSPTGNSGFQDLNTRFQNVRERSWSLKLLEDRLLSSEEKARAVKLSSVLKQYGINEVIDFRDEVRPVFESVTIPSKKGFLGIGKEPSRTEQRQTDRFESSLHSELVKGGKNEPAVRITYYIPQAQDWRDFADRPGMSLIAEFVLPKSTAEEAEQILNDEPDLIRVMVEKVLKEKILKDPAVWGATQKSGFQMRPPYEKWDGAPEGGKIYFHKEEDAPGIHKESIRSVRKE